MGWSVGAAGSVTGQLYSRHAAGARWQPPPPGGWWGLLAQRARTFARTASILPVQASLMGHQGPLGTAQPRAIGWSWGPPRGTGVLAPCTGSRASAACRPTTCRGGEAWVSRGARPAPPPRPLGPARPGRAADPQPGPRLPPDRLREPPPQRRREQPQLRRP